MERELTDFINSSAQENNGLTREELERVTRDDEQPLREKRRVNL